MAGFSDLNRPLCVMPGCGRWSQIYAKPGTFGGSTMYLKTCARHNMEEVPIDTLQKQKTQK